jgi:hypothetical protein
MGTRVLAGLAVIGVCFPVFADSTEQVSREPSGPVSRWVHHVLHKSPETGADVASAVSKSETASASVDEPSESAKLRRNRVSQWVRHAFHKSPSNAADATEDGARSSQKVERRATQTQPVEKRPGSVARWIDHVLHASPSQSDAAKPAAYETTAAESEAPIVRREARNSWNHGNYFLADFIYWESNDFRNRGVIATQTTVTAPPGTTTVRAYSTATPDPMDEPGFRLLVGHWFTDLLAVEVGGFWLNPNEFTDRLSSSVQAAFGTTIIDTVALPTGEGLSSATFRLEAETSGFEANGRLLLWNKGRLNVDGIGGFRWIGHDETFQSALVLPTGVTIGESFAADNNLVGGQIGAEGWWAIAEYISLRAASRIGLMANLQEIRVTGPTAIPGRLTGPGNIGIFSNTDTAVTVDLGIGIVLNITPNLRGQLGYNAIWISDAVRALDQIHIAGIGAAPGLFPTNDELWLTGFSAGVEWAY